MRCRGFIENRVACRNYVGALTVDFPAVPDADIQHQQAFILNFGDQPILANSIFPKLSKAGAMQNFADAARIIQLGYAFEKKLQNSPCKRWIEFVQLAICLSGQLNLPCHNAS